MKNLSSSLSISDSLIDQISTNTESVLSDAVAKNENEIFEINTNALTAISSFLIAASIGQPRYYNLMSVIRSVLAISIKQRWLLEDIVQELQNILWDVDRKFYWNEMSRIALRLSYMDVRIDAEQAMSELRKWHYE